MCLALPMRVIKISDQQGTVELSGIQRQVNLQLLEKVDIGDYVIVHAGFAIQRLDEREAEKTLSLLRQMVEKL